MLIITTEYNFPLGQMLETTVAITAFQNGGDISFRAQEMLSQEKRDFPTLLVTPFSFRKNYHQMGCLEAISARRCHDDILKGRLFFLSRDKKE